MCIEKQQTLQSVLSGTDMANISTENAKQGHRYRALSILQQTIEDANITKKRVLTTNEEVSHSKKNNEKMHTYILR